MKHSLLLGEDEGLGHSLTLTFPRILGRLTSFRANELRLDNDWLLQIKDVTEDEPVDTVVINMFDDHYDRLNQQTRVFTALWSLLPQATFVVINSAVHHYITSDRSSINYAYQQVFNATTKLAFNLEDRRLYVPELVHGADPDKVARTIWSLVANKDSPQFMQFCIRT